jgi:ornithine carbamoyltransferase
VLFRSAFAEAAAGLGARIARLTPDEALRRGEAGATQDTARLLGQMYDAVECDDLPPEVVRRLQRSMAVPVFDGLARPDHPLQQLLAGVADPARRLQAVLIATLA